MTWVIVGSCGQAVMPKAFSHIVFKDDCREPRSAEPPAHAAPIPYNQPAAAAPGRRKPLEKLSKCMICLPVLAVDRCPFSEAIFTIIGDPSENHTTSLG